jgi:hypothetical protein
VLGCEEFDGVWVKRYRNGCCPRRPGGLDHLAEQFLMGQMNAIEVADGDRALLERLIELSEVANDLHGNEVDSRKLDVEGPLE